MPVQLSLQQLSHPSYIYLPFPISPSLSLSLSLFILFLPPSFHFFFPPPLPPFPFSICPLPFHSPPSLSLSLSLSPSLPHPPSPLTRDSAISASSPHREEDWTQHTRQSMSHRVSPSAVWERPLATPMPSRWPPSARRTQLRLFNILRWLLCYYIYMHEKHRVYVSVDVKILKLPATCVLC